MRYSVVLTAGFPAIATSLIAPHFDVIAHPAEHERTEEEVSLLLNEADAAIVLATDPVTRAVLESNPNLRMVATFAPDPGNIDVAAARELGVTIAVTPDADPEAMARIAATNVLLFLRGREPLHRIV